MAIFFKLDFTEFYFEILSSYFMILSSSLKTSLLFYFFNFFTC